MNPVNLGIVRRVVYAVIAMLAALPSAAQMAITPSTTLAAETGNNTSASSTFVAQENGNAGAGNISKLPIRNLLYAGSTTRIYAAVMPWFGSSDHMSVGYNSSDPAEIHAQVDDMLSRGIQGAIIPWYGPNRMPHNAMAINYMTEAQSRGGAFEFSIMVDVGSLVAYAQQNGCDVTQQLLDHLTYIANTFYGSPAYTRLGGRPVLLFFGVEEYYINWAQVRALAPGNPLFLIRNQGAFTHPETNGGYAWLEINTSNRYDMMLSYLDDYYSTALQHPDAYSFGSAYKGFNDTLAAWSANRVVDQQCGQTWLATLADVNKHYSSSNQLGALQLVTWNDYEEGTELETGVDNCVSVAAQASRTSLNWNLGSGGDDSTIDHYTVFISTDGQNLMPLTNIPSGAHSLDMSPYDVAPGNYILFVKAIGKPSVVNHMSNAVAFNPADQPPVASLSVTPNSGAAPLSVTASGSASGDPDGSITSSKIDFGDGTVASGLTATHTYQNPGKYTVTLTVTDNAGLFASTQSRITVNAGPGVVITSPQPGASLSSPVHVVASASMANPVSYMEVLIDGNVVFSIAGSSIETYIKVGSGAHALRVAAHDTTGAVLTSDVSINVGMNDAPPAAILTVTPLGPPFAVMACTSTSTDSDGWITGAKVDFGDGAIGWGVTAYHTYGSPGTYTVTASVTDNAGLSSSTSHSVTVGQAGQPAANADFAVSISPTVSSVNAGQTAAFTVTVAAVGGEFVGAVTLACAGAPAAPSQSAACIISPTSLTPGSTAATANVTIATVASTTAWLHPSATRIWLAYALWPPLFGMVLIGAAGGGRKRSTRVFFLIVVLALAGSAIATMTGCGGGGGGSMHVSVAGTLPGTYTVTITGTSGSLQHVATTTLTVH